jgi:hypothetical protein
MRKKTMHGGNGVKTRRKGVGGTQQSQKWLKKWATLHSKRHHLNIWNCATTHTQGGKILVGGKLQPPLLREERGR